MKLDIIDKPKTYWYEDLDGNEIPWDINGPGNPFPDNYEDGEVYQHSVGLEVHHSICKEFKNPAWPIRILKWVIKKMPNSWQGNPCQLYAGHSTIGSGFSVIRYLIENRDFTLDEAAIAYSNMCERCMNICSWEVEGHDLTLEESYLKSSRTHCDYCEVIDSVYDQQKKLWCCYRTMKLGGDVSKAWKQNSVYSGDDYWSIEKVGCHGEL